MLSPVLIIGMHRSGTSMIARLLEEMGLFLGKKKDENHEALFFRRLNAWLLRQSSGAWDNPKPIRDLLDNATVRELVTDYVNYLIQTPRVASYLGWVNYFRYRSLLTLAFPWGWKDPRTTFTLPLWLDLFPEAKVIHVYRHGVDVAASLLMRQRGLLKTAEALHTKRKRLHLYWLHPKRGGFTETLRCVSLDSGFTLWETYLTEAQDHVRQLGPRALALKYEKFVTEPSDSLASLASFCDLTPNSALVATLASEIRDDRAFAYRAKAELQTFADSVSERLRSKGY